MANQIKEIELLLAPYDNYDRLQKQGYTCFNVVGIIKGAPDYVEDIKRIPCVNAWNFLNNYNAQDYYAATLGFEHFLNDNSDKILKHFRKSMQVTGSPKKIAFLGFINKDGYCFRYVFARFLMQEFNRLYPRRRIILNETDIRDWNNFMKSAYTDTYYKQTDIAGIPEDNIEAILSSCKWVTAKTQPNNPHQYTLRRDWGSHSDFEKVAAYIRVHGTIEFFAGQVYRVLYIGELKYWSCASDTKNSDVDLINRTEV